MIVLIIFGVALVIAERSSSPQGDTVAPGSSAQIAQSAWSACTNTYGGYSFLYPSSWHVLKAGAGGAIETACENAGANFSLNPVDPNYATSSNGDYNAGSIQLSFIKGTDLNGIPKSLDDFFAQRPAILKSHKLLVTGIVADEKAVWLQEEPENGFVDIYFWHNGDIMKITADKVSDAELLNNILKSFTF